MFLTSQYIRFKKYVFLLYLVFIINSVNVAYGQTTLFYEDFEFTDDIENHGYIVTYNGTSWSRINSDFYSSGSNSLEMHSQPCGGSSISKMVNMEYTTDLKLSYAIYWWGGNFGSWTSGGFRIYLESNNNQTLILSYNNDNSTHWESNQQFNINYTSPELRWYFLDRNLQTDITMALDNVGSQLLSFSPEFITKIEFYSTGVDNCHTLYDQIKIYRPYSPPIQTTSVVTTTDQTTSVGSQTSDTVPSSTFGYPSRSSGNDNSIFWQVLIIAGVFVMGLGAFKFLKKHKEIDPQLRLTHRSRIDNMYNDTDHQSITNGNVKQIKSLSNLCIACGEILDGIGRFCSNCGTQISK